MNKIELNERNCYNEIFNLIYKGIPYNDFLNEEYGHPLFSNKNNDFIDRIKNTINILNKKLKLLSKNSDNIKGEFFNIVKYNQNEYILKFKEYKPISININSLGFKDIINTKNSNIKIIIRDIKESVISYEDYHIIRNISTGKLVVSTARKTKDGKFINISDDKNIMYMNIYAINGKIIPISFLNVFLHEYNHFYEHYNRLLNNSNTYYTINAKEFEKMINTLFSNELSYNEINSLKNLIYNLYLGEDNAKIGNTFADLVSLDIDSLSKLRINKNKIDFYSLYDELKNDLEIVKNINTDILGELLRDFSYIDIFNFSENDSNLRICKKFINHLIKQLNKFYKKQIKFIGQYIYMQNSYNNSIINAAKI